MVALLKKGSKPANIVAFTFTDKAAAELKDRIVTRFREELGHIHGLAEIYIGTIHSFKDEQERGPDILRLANALSALYPKDSDERRWCREGKLPKPGWWE